MRAAALLALVIALAGCSAMTEGVAAEPAERATATTVALSADDDDRAMFQCITFLWGYDIFPTAAEARENCEWLRANNADAYADYLDMYRADYPSLTDVPDPDAIHD